MCLLGLYYRVSAAAPIMLAANREEYFDRPFTSPGPQAGSPRVFCGLDSRAHGTWLGVNQHGLLIAVTNRPGGTVPAPAGVPSRGTLCRQLLDLSSSAAAVERALAELANERYQPVNVLCVDREQAAVVTNHRRAQVSVLGPGLHLLANGELNDPQDMRQAYARALLAPRFPRTPDDFVKAARHALSQGLDPSGQRTIVVHHAERGTVCSSLVVLAALPSQSQYFFAGGSPDLTPYEDLSAGLRQVLSGC